MARNPSAGLPPPPPIPFRHGLGNSLEMLRAALGYLDVETTTGELAGLSGAAFRVYWPRPPGGVWDADVVSLGAFDPLAVASETFGWKLLRYRETAPTVAWQFAVQALGRRQPLLASGLLEDGEEILVIGVRQEEQARLFEAVTRHVTEPVTIPCPREEPDAPSPPLSVGLFEPIPPHRRISREESMHRALRRAVWVADVPPRRNDTGVAVGTEAYRAWIATLLRPEPPGVAEAERLMRSSGLALPDEATARDRVVVRHVLHRALSSYAEARDWAVAFLESAQTGHRLDTPLACYRAEAKALREAERLWPPVVVRSGEGFALAPAPAGFDRPLWFEETVRCLRVAAETYAEATAALDAAVPMLEQERIDPDAEDDEEGSDSSA
ncbi:MAG: hypothetical protein GF346_03050 [Candidatus Eisenbacteria bacterium]|nr:hypothetical protein [Candidatus Latescibacterota bacterium]MBD3301399.1 hypothetical protein [Candidatus Eisenbacteria bacterium]